MKDIIYVNSETFGRALSLITQAINEGTEVAAAGMRSADLAPIPTMALPRADIRESAYMARRLKTDADCAVFIYELGDCALSKYLDRKITDAIQRAHGEQPIAQPPEPDSMQLHLPPEGRRYHTVNGHGDKIDITDEILALQQKTTGVNAQCETASETSPSSVQSVAQDGPEPPN